jgi:hypothetical protein
MLARFRSAFRETDSSHSQHSRMRHIPSTRHGICSSKLKRECVSVDALRIRKGIVMAHEENRSCLEACVRCAQECEHCASACLEEPDIAAMAECIRLDRDCAEICWTAAAWMSRGSRMMHEICRLCAEVCDACGNECRKHEVEHCVRCAEVCAQCTEECRRMAAVAT